MQSEELTQRKYKDLGPLHDLLIRASPPDDNGNQSIPRLAVALEVTDQAVYNMIERNKVSPRMAGKIVTVAEGRVSLDDLSPYVFK